MPRELPKRRNAPIIDFTLFDGYQSQGYSAQYAEFVSGDIAEVFLRPVGNAAAKPGLPLDNMAKDLSVLFSIARRYGAPVSVIKDALSQQADGKMLGPLGEFLRLYDEGHGDDEASMPNVVPHAPVSGGSAAAEVV